MHHHSAHLMAAPHPGSPHPPSPRLSPPPPLDFLCLNGVRVLASAAVVLFHSFVVWQMLLPFPWEERARLRSSHWFIRLASLAGPAGADAFLVLTGMLAAYQLLPRLDQSLKGRSCNNHVGCGSGSLPSHWAVVRGYWRRRAARLLPAYIAANAALLMLRGPTVPPGPEAAVTRAFSMGGCPSGLYANALFSTNLISCTATCGLHFWTLAMQAQFCLLFPLLLLALRPRAPDFRRRLGCTLAATVGSSVAWRAWRAATALPHLPLGNPAVDFNAHLSLMDNLYLPPGPRIAQLGIGAALGLLLRSPVALSWVARRRRQLSVAALALAAAVVTAALRWDAHSLPGQAHWPRAGVVAFSTLVYFGSPVTSLAIAANLLALMLSAGPLHAAAAVALRARALRPLAALSYSIYLIHELARLQTFLHLVPPGAVLRIITAAPVVGLAVLAGGGLAAGYAGALLLHHGVEKAVGLG